MLTVVSDVVDGERAAASDSGSSSLIDEIVREGARGMLAEALRAEVDDYVARSTDEHDDTGRRLAVRNGSHAPRDVLTSAGSVEVVAPRIDDRRVDPETDERQRFSSAILPQWAVTPVIRGAGWRCHVANPTSVGRTHRTAG